MYTDDGPSPDDLRRFSDDTAYCPDCGEEIYDEAPACPECGAWIEGRTLSRPMVAHESRRQFRTLVIVLTLLGFLAGIGVLNVFF